MPRSDRVSRPSTRPSVVPAAALVAALATHGLQAAPPSLVGAAAETPRTLDVVADPQAWSARAAGDAPFVLPAVDLGQGRTVDLRLERFRVTTAETRFVRGADATPIAFDPDRVVLLRGSAVGHDGSHVFIAVTEDRAFGTLDLGGAAYRLGSSADDAPGAAPGGLPPGLPLCLSGATAPVDPPAPPALPAGAPPTPPGTVVIEVAVETDFEFFSLFGDLDAAGAYVVALYGAISDIYRRDFDAKVEISFVRLWDDPDDLFDEESPLVPFREYWNDNMDEVHRDVAQFISGRRDMPYGGAAYLGSLCGGSAYSVVGYVVGRFGSLETPDVLSYDVAVTAHELGHNVDSNHTHAYEIDTCDDLDGTPQRGTIMSYCSQTVSGGQAMTDLRFHTFVQSVVRSYLADRFDCRHYDCNDNGVDDADDIAGGGSLDVNGNSIPDECEDCNGNGMLDGDDILGGDSLDLNSNGVPDECEPDCNGNSVPDDKDIADGTSVDVHGNGVPDECEADCDGDGVADYNQIQLDLSLDLDRNAILDSCEDCDGDATPDLEALAGAHSAWGIGRADGAVREFHPLVGTVMRDSRAGAVSDGHDVVVTDDGRILVSSAADDRVVEFDRTGAEVGDFVAAGAGGLVHPTNMTIGPGGNLYVSSRDTDSVLVYDGATGASLGVFVASGAGGLSQPYGLEFGPNGNLFVTSGAGEVLQFDGEDGFFLGTFVDALDNGGLTTPRGIAFKPDGNLLVASSATNQVLEYDGATGAFLRQFNRGGTDSALTLDRPWGIRIGPDGGVYVSRNDVEAEHHDADPFLRDPIALHINASRIYLFDAETGNFQRSYVTGNDTGYDQPTGFDFYPGADIDCNLNARPDECDIARGLSADVNGNGVPDECEPACVFADLDGDGEVAFDDLLVVLAGWGPCDGPCPADLNGDGAVDFTDLLVLLSTWGPCETGS
jgi:DNA-binding beta-propeller fold protein YncE